VKNFATIGAAISAVPPKSTVEVCPGSYAEQLTINQPLTLKGVISGTAGAAVITVNGSLGQNGTTPDFGPVAAQILVQNTTGVFISNLTVDGGAQPGCVAGSQIAGIAYSNVGTTGTAAGTLTGLTVRNEIAGCGSVGILSDNAFIKIASNNVQGTDGMGIAVDAGDNNITLNAIAGVAEGIFAQQVNTPTVISMNTLLNVTGTGINLSGSNGLQVTSNIVGMTTAGQAGIFVGAGNQTTTVTGNKVFGGTNGVVLNGATTSTVKTNTIGMVSGNALVFTSSGGNNNVT
jgi:parallel beta-helix repeat protein